MKCANCGGGLGGAMKFCSFCGVRADVDLRQIHFRDLGNDDSKPCPSCAASLSIIEIDVGPKVEVERCATCRGIFFNPGEVEALLEGQTNPFVWLDPVQLQQISNDFMSDREIMYRKCPYCAERMSHFNFGGHSGVIIDRCGTHGVWLEGSQLRRLTEWWRAGGRLIYLENEAKRTKNLYFPEASTRPAPHPVSVDIPPPVGNWPAYPPVTDFLPGALDLIPDLWMTVISTVLDD